MKKIFIVSLLVFFVQGAIAQTNEHYSNYIKGANIAVDSTVTTIDDKWNSPVWPTILQHTQVSNNVSFQIDFESGYVLPEVFSLDAQLQVTAWDSLGDTTIQILNCQLSYDTATVDSLTYKSSLNFQDNHKIEVKILSLLYIEGDSTFNNSDIPSLFKLSATIDIERVYAFDCEDNMSVLWVSVPQFELLNWTNYSGATDYDIEWVFFEKESEIGKRIQNGPVPTLSELPDLFNNNSTRVNTTGFTYFIPAVYHEGYLFVRIRPAATLSHIDRAVSKWNYVQYYSDYYATITRHESKFNFVYSADFAEEGKMLETVNYFDGSLKSRQKVNRFERAVSGTYSSPLLISEVIYDHLGRPALNVLPAPPVLKDDPLQYFESFNKNLNGDPYTFLDFEEVDCSSIPEGMNANSGASNYYSPSNNYISTFKESYLPDAKLYPFSITEFTPDNTGRISRQSNVGEDLQLGSQHETKYFYGRPSQDELDYIFGTDAGIAGRFTKEMVVDPNKTTSVSIKDASNRVVATAIAGDVPTNLGSIQHVGFYPNPEQPQIQNVINVLENAEVVGSSLVASTVIMLPSAQDIVLDFSLTGDTLMFTCGETSFCFDCTYDIHTIVTSGCNDAPIYDSWSYNFNFESGFDILCNGGTNENFQDTLPNQPAGTYNITVEIKVNDAAFNYYKEQFLQYGICNTLDDFMSAGMGQLDLSGCYTTCEECKTALGSLNDYLTAFEANMNSQLLPYDEQVATEIYNELYNDCENLCGHGKICEEIYELMLDDVSPGGQYATYTVNEGTNEYSSNSTVSIFTAVGQNSPIYSLPIYQTKGESAVFLVDGNLVPANELPLNIFIENFEPEWATQLVRYHPEYCYYEFCIAHEEEQDYIEEMMQVSSYQEAVDNDWITPFDPNGDHPDPILNNSGFQDLVNAFVDTVNNFLVSWTNPLNSSESCTLANPISIWTVAYLSGLTHNNMYTNDFECVDITNTQILQYFNGTIPGYTVCGNDKDKAWFVFRALYKHLRDSLYEQMEANYIRDSCDCTEHKCIGCTTNDCPTCNLTIGGSIPEYENIGHQEYISCSLSTDLEFSVPRWLHYQEAGGALFGSHAGGNTFVNNALDDHCASVCSSYIDLWKLELQACAFNQNGAWTEDATIQALYNVCMNGCDLDHPLGSSSFPSGSCSYGNCSLTNFQLVLDASGVEQDKECNASLLHAPIPYGAAGTQADLPTIVFDSIPDCACDQINLLYAQCDTCTSTQDFYTYLSQIFGQPTFTIGQLDEMRDYCDTISPDICLELGDGIILPSYLSCQNCLPCESIEESVHEYTDIYISSDLYLTNGPVGGPDYLAFLTYYLNEDLNTYHTLVEYQEMFKYCEISWYDTTCTSFTYLYDAWSHPDTITDYPYSYFMNLAYNFNLSCEEWEIWITGKDCLTSVEYPCALDTLPTCTMLWDAIRNYMDNHPLPTLSTSAHYYNTMLQFFYDNYWDDISSVSQYEALIDSCRGIFSLNVNYPPQALFPNIAEEFGDIWFDAPEKAVWLWLTHYPEATFYQVKHVYDSLYAVKCTTYTCDQLDTLIMNYSYTGTPTFDLHCNTILPDDFTTFDYDQWVLTCDKGKQFMLCTDPILPTISNNVFPDCQEQAINNLVAEVNLQYQVYVEQQVEEFEDRYISKCMNPLIEFTATHPLDQYHYTLYYYDQAGNLVKTVAPQGVRILDVYGVADVRAYRDGSSTTPVYPAHRFDTKYWYNALNKPIKQWTPDSDTTWFWYDDLGRLILSQNSKQLPLNLYSYTIYDKLSRIIETGQIEYSNSTVIARNASQEDIDDMITGNNLRTEVVQTWYDDVKFSSIPITQENLRKRIASVTIEKNYDVDDMTYDHATHYSYDLSGNVSVLLQDNPSLSSISQQFKQIQYDYDLVSGKVNYVHYQTGSNDHFDYKYEYDSRNRLIDAQSSIDYGTTWEHDAVYTYWRHGPLKRTILGERQVQGLDYVYTLQGWLKSMNYAKSDTSMDVGGDGRHSSNLVASDVFSQALGYFENDYESLTADKLDAGASSSGMLNSPDLYNGNIRYQQSSFGSNKFCKPTLGYAYNYDLLNRLQSSQTYDGSNFETPLVDYRMDLTYDGNGNIDTLIRNAANECGIEPLFMDSMKYFYYTNSKEINNQGYYWPTNRLNYVLDTIGIKDNLLDINSSQLEFNYLYDSIGNLILDQSEQISISWNHFNKISNISCTKSGFEYSIDFNYDAFGNRIEKKYTNLVNNDVVQTFYIYDTQGNILATYNWKNSTEFKWMHQYLYGSSRVGVYNPELQLYPTEETPNSESYFLDEKNYEVTDHLGNVMAVVSDYKTGIDKNSDNISDYYKPIIRSMTDYYPFGMVMPERNFSDENYRFGFNGKEKDDTVKGHGNSIDFGARMYDPRLGRWLSLDPLAMKYPQLSPYCFVGNMPIIAIDPDGKIIKIVSTDPIFRSTAFAELQKITDNDLILLKDGQVITKDIYETSQKAGLENDLAGIEIIGNANSNANSRNFGTQLVNEVLMDPEIVEIKESNGDNKTTTTEDALIENGKGAGSTIEFNPNKKVGGKNVDGTRRRPAFIGLGHELIHSRHNQQGKNEASTKSSVTDPDGTNKKLTNEEVKTRKEENILRRENNVIERKTE